MVCFTGDGGLYYHIQELETAVRCKIPSVIIVNNNSSMNQERNVYIPAYDGKPSEKWGDMWIFTQVSLSQIARDFGAEGFRAERPEEIAPAVRQALACGRPALVEVISDPAAMGERAKVD